MYKKELTVKDKYHKHVDGYTKDTTIIICDDAGGHRFSFSQFYVQRKCEGVNLDYLCVGDVITVSDEFMACNNVLISKNLLCEYENSDVCHIFNTNKLDENDYYKRKGVV